MKLTGLKTMKETIDFALTEAERVPKINEMLSDSFMSMTLGMLSARNMML